MRYRMRRNILWGIFSQDFVESVGPKLKPHQTDIFFWNLILHSRNFYIERSYRYGSRSNGII